MTQRWRIGDLAKAAGLTVRTLHHYEQLGLLAPARNSGKQRLYDSHDVQRLYRVRALRDLGLSLSEVRDALEGRAAPLSELLRKHLDGVDAELKRLRRLRAMLAHAARKGVDPEEVLATIEAMSEVSRAADKRAGAKSTEVAWRSIARRLRARMKAGDAPATPRVRAIAKEAHALIVQFSGGERSTIKALARLRKNPPEKFGGWDPPLFRYLDRALEEEDT
ncbi:MAG: MerR family transcriptional regulator [Myxococcaceae bacterium]